MIELKDIYFSYDGERVIRGASLSLGKECVALVGPNGSGKTTLLKIMAGIYRPDRGEVIIEGRNLWKLPEREAVRLRRKVVYVHERPIVLRGSVMYNATFGLRIRGTEEASSRVIDLLKEVGIEDLSRDARTLSAGQAQLLALVRAIVVDPLYLLLDEPFANLDLDRRRTVL
ncbi:MAG TPA: ABC transporter ATP-binding protein, partial [Candidatus Korarchaeota archaeon]|nr:ABC transporter ATP-binding protein [Candidatus Korarchaeota archaeon]